MSELPTGRELDALVAERVMGIRILSGAEMQVEAEKVWREQPECMVFLMGFHAVKHWSGGPTLEQEFHPYSTSIATAWEVVEKMEQSGWMVTLMNWHYYGDRAWTARFTSHPLGPKSVEVRADSAPHAICLAALAAQGNPTRDPEAPSDEGEPKAIQPERNDG